jgi:hypothetical protein
MLFIIAKSVTIPGPEKKLRLESPNVPSGPEAKEVGRKKVLGPVGPDFRTF